MNAATTVQSQVRDLKSVQPSMRSVQTPARAGEAGTNGLATAVVRVGAATRTPAQQRRCCGKGESTGRTVDR